MTFITQKEIQKIEHINEEKDTFGRIKVCNPVSLLDINHVVNKNDIQESETLTGGGTSTHLNGCSVNLAVSSGGDSVIRQSRKRAIYQPGKSLSWLITGVLNYNNNATTTTSRIGCYDDDNGFYFQFTNPSNNPTISIVKRSRVSGSVVNTVINQANWNGKDKLDGNGASGITLDLSKTQIFSIAYSWLGVGLVRVGVVIAGVSYVLHEFEHANNETDPYTQYGSLPSRCEISSTGGAGEMLHVCTSAQSEGGYVSSGSILGDDYGITTKTISTTETPVYALSLRLANGGSKGNIDLTNFSLLRTDKNDALYRVWLFRDLAATSVLTGSSFADVGNISSVDKSATAITTTGGQLIYTGYLGDKTEGIDFGSADLTLNTTLGMSISGVPDLLVISSQVTTGTDDVFASIGFRESF